MLVNYKVIVEWINGGFDVYECEDYEIDEDIISLSMEGIDAFGINIEAVKTYKIVQINDEDKE